MDFHNLILQGGALAVVLFAFIAVLQWLLKHLSRQLTEIEHAIQQLNATIQELINAIRNNE